MTGESNDLPRELMDLLAEIFFRQPPPHERALSDLMKLYPEHTSKIFELASDHGCDLALFDCLGTIPDKIGSYRIVRRLDEGGFAIVYLAETTDGASSRVALKVLKSWMNSTEILGKFWQEERILKRMRHNNIATILDSGTTAQGQPYLVMDYIDGKSITDYSNDHELDVDDRVRLMSSVCEAVHHAHQRTVTHRDLVPRNILVTDVDGKPCPKIIDFGLAHVLDPDLALSSAQSREQRGGRGTLRHMSPEQVSPFRVLKPGHLIDTRTDIYSIGSVLYELLTGVSPFPVGDATDDHEIERQIIEVTPPLPSKRSLSEDGKSRRFGRRLRGDLDWIMMRALEKDPDRRYGTVAEFHGDLRAYLENGIVLAKRPTLAYRMKKLVRRNRVLASAVALVLIMAVAAVLIVRESTASFDRLELERKFGDAQELFERADHANCLKLLRGLIENRDAPIAAYGLLGDECLLGNNYIDACRYYRIAASNSSERANAWGLALATSLLERRPIEVPWDDGWKPLDARGFAIRGLVYAFMDNQECALEDFRKAVENQSTCAVWESLRGDACLRFGRWREALGSYLAAEQLSIAPSDPRIVHHIAMTYNKLRRFADAIELVRATLIQHESDRDLHLDLAFALAATGKIEAVDQANRARELAPHDAYAVLYSASVLINLNKLDELEELLAKEYPYISGTQEHVAVMGFVARLEYDKLKLLECGRRLADSPQRWARTMGLDFVASAYSLLGRREDAIEKFRELHDLEPENANWLAQEGQRLGEIGDLSHAEGALTSATALDPSNIEAYAALSALCIKKGDLARALDYGFVARGLEISSPQTSGNVEGLYGIANAYFAFNELKLAKAAIDIVCSRYNNWEDAWLVAASIADALKDYSEAARCRKMILTNIRNSPSIRADLAESYHLLGRDADSLIEYDDALRDDPTLAEAWCGKGILLFESRDPKIRNRWRALFCCRQAYKFHPCREHLNWYIYSAFLVLLN